MSAMVPLSPTKVGNDTSVNSSETCTPTRCFSSGSSSTSSSNSLTFEDEFIGEKMTTSMRENSMRNSKHNTMDESVKSVIQDYSACVGCFLDDSPVAQQQQRRQRRHSAAAIVISTRRRASLTKKDKPLGGSSMPSGSARRLSVTQLEDSSDMAAKLRSRSARALRPGAVAVSRENSTRQMEKAPSSKDLGRQAAKRPGAVSVSGSGQREHASRSKSRANSARRLSVMELEEQDKLAKQRGASSRTLQSSGSSVRRLSVVEERDKLVKRRAGSSRTLQPGGGSMRRLPVAELEGRDALAKQRAGSSRSLKPSGGSVRSLQPGGGSARRLSVMELEDGDILSKQQAASSRTLQAGEAAASHGDCSENGQQSKFWRGPASQQPGAEAVSGGEASRREKPSRSKNYGGSSRRLSVMELEENKQSKEKGMHGSPTSASTAAAAAASRIQQPQVAESKYHNSMNDSSKDQHSTKLVEARPVVEETDEELAMEIFAADGEVDLEEQQRTRQRQEETKRKRKAWTCKVGLGLCLCLVAIVVGTYFAVRPGSDQATADAMDASPSLPPSQQATAPPSTAPYIIDLPNSTIEKILQDFDSPQASAYRWLERDPYLEQYVGQEFRLVQRYALATLYYALDGDNWLMRGGWMDYNISECEWEDKGGYGLPAMEMRGLSGSELVGRIVNGTFTGEAFDWSDFLYTEDRMTFPPKPICSPKNEFCHLKIHKNNVRGQIPEELALIPSLALMDISYNDGLTGSIPTSFGSLKNMKYLMMEETGISGSIPSEIGDMECLRIFSTSGTRFSEGTTIPTEIGNLKVLTTLLLAFSGVVGTLPSELGLLAQNLTVLDVSSRSDDPQSIGGTMPSELGLLTNLHVFTCGDCDLEGTLPSQLGLMTELEILSIGPSNDLVGTIPTSLGGLTNLKYARLTESQLSGQIPSQWGLFTGLARMYIMNNQLSGPLPSELGKMTKLASVSINGNQGLTGTLPPELVTGWSESLFALNISGTMIAGTMSPSFCSLPGFFEFECSATTCGCNCTCAV